MFDIENLENENYSQFQYLVKSGYSFAVTGLIAILRLFLLKQAAKISKKKVLFITTTEQNALKYQNDLRRAFDVEAAILPFQNISMYETISPNGYEYAEQIRILREKPEIVIAPVKVMLEKFPNEKFFEEYAKMSRSKEGLKAAGEWHQLKPLFPSLEGKSVLDLGCGYGWHCKFAEEQGATKILGIDLSKKMIEEAQKRNSGNQIEYRISGLEEYDYPENEWDCVISNLALHYIEDIVEIFQKVYRTLKPGGIFLFNIEHPVFTAGVGQDWIYTDDGKPQYWAIDNYFITGERNTHFLGCDVVKQHHTLTQIIMGLLNNGFELKVVEEAEPPKEMMDIPGMEDELRRPMMLLVKAIAKK